MTLKFGFEVSSDLVILMTQMHVQVRHGYRSISVHDTFGTKGGRFRMTEVIRLVVLLRLRQSLLRSITINLSKKNRNVDSMLHGHVD